MQKQKKIDTNSSKVATKLIDEKQKFKHIAS